MFKSARWRSEKNKIKAVFKLQFQATQVPKLKTPNLTVSLVPADVGKPTVRLERASIVDGTCFWENPVYETVKLIRERKTGRFSDKFYHFIVSTGSSKGCLLGEVSINFADYAEAAKPSTVSLPLKTSNHRETGAILHVTIHKMQGSIDQRDIEEGEAQTTNPQNGSLKNQPRNHDTNGNGNLTFTGDECINRLTSENDECTENLDDLLLENSIICLDDTAATRDLVPKRRTVDTFQKNWHAHRRSNTDWSVSSVSDISMVDSTNSPDRNLSRDRLPDASDRSIEKLVSEISVLERQAEVLELELQSLRKQIVKEGKRGQDLLSQIVSLKEERDALKTECRQLKSSLKCSDDAEVSNQLQMEIEKLNVILEEIRLELNLEKDLNIALRLQLQKTEDSNLELILAVRDLEEMLEHRNREITNLTYTINASKNNEDAPEEVSDYNKETKEVDLFKQITDLYSEIEVYKKDQDVLKMHKEQLATDYENLKQENSDLSLVLEKNQIEQIKMQNECTKHLRTIKEFKLQVEKLEKEIEKHALELSESSETINELEAQVKSLKKELEQQAQGFEDDLECITNARIEQEQRAIRAEEALRKTRSNNAVAAERIQEEFRRLSVDMASKFDENEKLAMKAVTEANELRLQKKVLEERLKQAAEEHDSIKERYEVKIQELSDQTVLKSKQVEHMSHELKEKILQIENFKNQEEKMHEVFSIDIQKLRSEIESVKMKNSFSEEAEQNKRLIDKSGDMEQMKTSTSEQEMLQRCIKEREELKRELALVKREAQQLQEESNDLRSLKDEKETLVRTLQSDIEKLRVQYNDLIHCLSEVELKKENLKKVFKLKGDRQKKEDVITMTEKLTSSARQCEFKLLEKSTPAGTFNQDGVGMVPCERYICDRIASTLGFSEVETSSDKKLNLSTFPTSDDCHLTQLLSEMALLKESNKYMEVELKEMQERYSEISLKFAEVEGERQRLVMTVRNLKNSKS